MKNKRLLMTKLSSFVLLVIVFLSCILGGCTQTAIEDNPSRPYHTDRLNIYYSDPGTLDPAIVTDLVTCSYLIQIFSGLVTVDAKGQIIGDMAYSWDVSPDGLIYTFYLHPDIFFHDGTRMTPEDIKFSWIRALHPTTNSRIAYSYLGHIVGADAVAAGLSLDLVGVTVIDNQTLQVQIKEASSYFLAGLAYPCAFVVSAKQILTEGVNWVGRPVGTGPYQIMENYYGSYITLKSFSQFYGPQATIENIKFITEPNRRTVEMFESGEVDITHFSSLYLDKVLDSYGFLRQQAHQFERLTVWYLAFCVDKAPFDDPLVRQAFSMAIDIDKLAATVYRGYGVAATGFVPNGIFGYEGALWPYTFDPQAAKDLIAKSKYDSVENLPTIYLACSEASSELAAIVDQWQTNLGVKVEIVVLETTVFYDGQANLNSNVLYYGWGADYAHPQNFLEILLSSDGAFNLGHYHNASYDTLIKMANAATDPLVSFALYQQAEAMALDDAAVLPLFFSNSYILVNKNLQGYEAGLFDIPVLNTVSYREVPL